MKQVRQYVYNLLRKSEKVTRTDMVYLAKGGFWLSLGQGLMSLSSLILAIAFANLYSKDAYGYYKYIISIAGVLSAVTLTGLDVAIIRSVAKGYDGVLKKSFWLSLKWSVGMIILSIIGAAYYLYNDNIVLGYSLLIIGSLSPFLNSASLYSPFLNGKKDFKTNSIFSILRNLIPAACILLTILFTKNVLVLVAVYFISNTLVNVYLYNRTLKKYNVTEEVDPEFTTYGKHLSLMNVLGTVGDKIDSILIFQFLGSTPLSIYSFAVSIPSQIVGFLRNLSILTVPKFSERTAAEIKKEIPRKILRLGSILIVMYVLYVLVAPYIYTVLFPQYISSIPYSQVFALIILVNVGLIPNAFFESQMAIKEKYIMNITSQVLRIILMSTLIFFYGIWGVIIAQLVTKFTMLTISFILIARYKEPTKTQEQPIEVA